MSFVLPVSWSPTVNARTLTYEPNQIFNPNATFGDTDALRTIEGFIHFLKCIYTRENLLAHPTLLLNIDSSYAPLVPNDYVNIINAVPEEHLWTLYFFCIHGRNSSNHIKYSYWHLRERNGGEIWFSEYYPQVISFTPSQIRNDTVTVFNEINNHNPIFRFNADELTYSFVIVFYKWLTGKRMAYDPLGDLRYSRSDAQILVARNPTVSVEFSEDRHNSGTFSLYIKRTIVKADKSPLYNIFNYSTNPLSMLTWPLITKSEHKPILYGVELEFTTDYSTHQLIDATDEPFFILKQDSSISGSRKTKVELVTVPMSFKAHKQQWAWWFSNLDYNQFDTTKDTTNGMHVHIDKKAFTEKEHLPRFTFFLTRKDHTDFLIAFSERTKTSFTQYSSVPNAGNSTDVQSYRNSVHRASQIRGLVHFSNKNTVEIRLFKGIVSFADIVKNLEFVDSVYHYTLQFPMPQMTLDGYFTWLSSLAPNKYPILRKHIRANLNIEPFLLYNKVWVFLKSINKNDHDGIASAINGSKFPLGNELVTALNRRYEKRIFNFDKQKQLVIVSNNNKSKVAFLDRILEKKYLKDKPTTVVSPTQDPITTPAPTPRRARRLSRQVPIPSAPPMDTADVDIFDVVTTNTVNVTITPTTTTSNEPF
jgi:hypothetical protein